MDINTYQDKTKDTAFYMDNFLSFLVNYMDVVLDVGDTNLKYKLAGMFRNTSLLYLNSGLGGECGEWMIPVKIGMILNILKKQFRQGNWDDLDEKLNLKIIDEMGDIFWYMSMICNELNIKLSVVLQNNLDKLKQRKELNEFTDKSEIYESLDGTEI